TVSVTPNGAGVVAVNPPLMQGHFSVDDNSAAVTVKAVVSWKGPGPAPQKFPVQDVCPGAQCTADTNGNTDIKDFPLSAVDWNGPYHVEATGDAKDPFGDSTVTTGADFHAAVPPPDPAKVAASVNKDRSVTVAWDRITGTPDLQPFYVYRKGPGDKDFHSFARVLQPASGDRVAIPDPDTKAAGGSYTYQVEARRNGVSGDDTSFV